MKFIQYAQDPWHTVHGDDGPMVTITPKPNLLLTWLQWHSVCHHWPVGMPVGVIVENDQDVRELEADLPRLGLIALRFPKWVDGPRLQPGAPAALALPPSRARSARSARCWSTCCRCCNAPASMRWCCAPTSRAKRPSAR